MAHKESEECDCWKIKTQTGSQHSKKFGQALLTDVRQVGGFAAMASDHTFVCLNVPVNQRGGDTQQTEGPAAEQHGAKHLAAE